MWRTPVPVYARRIKQVTLLDAGFRVECLRDVNRFQNTCYCFLEFAKLWIKVLSCGLKKKEEEEEETWGIMNCGINNLEIN